MTQREKVLAGMMGGVVAVGVGYSVVKKVVIDRFNDMHAKIADAETRRANLLRRVNDESHWPDEWKDLVAHTFAGDEVLAQQELRKDVQQLLDRYGMAGARVSNVAAARLKSGASEVAVTVDASGSIDQIVRLLRDIYQRPYLKQLYSLTIDAKEQRIEPGGAEQPYTLNLKLATLLPPKLPGIEGQRIADLDQLNAMEQPLNPLDGMTLAMAPESYDRISEINIWQNYLPPKPYTLPPPPPPDDPNGGRDKGRPAPPPPDPRRNADKLKVIGTAALDGEPVVYVQKTDRLTEPPARHHVGDKVDDGEVVLIHPTGMVVRTVDEKRAEGGRTNEIDYFYPLGATFKERERLDAGDHPDVFTELELAYGSE